MTIKGSQGQPQVIWSRPEHPFTAISPLAEVHANPLESAELEAEFGLPSDYDNDEAIDMTAWVKHSN